MADFPDPFFRPGKLSFLCKEKFPAMDDNFPSYARKAMTHMPIIKNYVVIYYLNLRFFGEIGNIL